MKIYKVQIIENKEWLWVESIPHQFAAQVIDENGLVRMTCRSFGSFIESKNEKIEDFKKRAKVEILEEQRWLPGPRKIEFMF